MKFETKRTRVITDTDKIPPQATDVEEILLGTLLVYPESIYEINIKPEMFYKDAHNKIYKAIYELASTGTPDLITVTNKLRENGELDTVGGPYVLTSLTSNIFTDQMVKKHALIIKEKYLRREYIRIGAELQGISFDESFDFKEVVDFAENSLFLISDFTQTQEPVHISKCIDEVLEEVHKIYTKEKTLVGIPSGFTDIDRYTGGWQPGNLIIVAGRPSMGKSALALILSSNPAKLGSPVLFLSLEMSKEELATRFLSGETEYTNVEIRNADVNFDKLVNGSHKIACLPIIIDDTPGIGLYEVRSKIKKQIIRNHIKLVIIDYLQLMSADANSREQEVSKISRGLKAISKEFNIPIIALSQLNREVESRADRRPRLSDLRESGSLEQDADIVCFVFRPKYYGMGTATVGQEEISSENLMIVDCGKNRNGALFSKALYHNQSMTKIQEQKFELRNEPY